MGLTLSFTQGEGRRLFEMKRLAEIPYTRPAANARAPLRKGRSRRQVGLAKTEGRKQAYVDLLAAGENRSEAAARLQTSPKVLWEWERLDPEFKEKCRQAIEDRRLLGEGKLMGSLDEAIDVAVKRGVRAENPKLAVDSAFKVMRACGLPSEEGVINTGQTMIQDNRRLIVNILNDPETRRQAIALQRTMEARAGLYSGEAGAGELETGGAPGLSKP